MTKSRSRVRFSSMEEKGLGMVGGGEGGSPPRTKSTATLTEKQSLDVLRLGNPDEFSLPRPGAAHFAWHGASSGADKRRVAYPSRVQSHRESPVGGSNGRPERDAISDRGPGSAQRVLFVGKYGLDDSAGNAVAVRRMMSAFADRGVGARYMQSSKTPGEAAFALFGFTPAVVHALHAGEAARLGAELAKACEVPLVVTVTGTDLNGGADGTSQEDARRESLARLRPAAAVVALTAHQEALLEKNLPDHRIVRIAQSVVLGDEEFELRDALDHVAGPKLASKRIALLAGGLRPVKGQMLALEAFERAAAKLDDWLLVLAGPVLDEAYAAQVREKARALPHAVYIGEIPHAAMAHAMGQCDVLLNSSESEGEAQVILEAQCVSLPVVARRVVGNTALVEDGVTGWLFDDYAGLAAILGRLGGDPDGLAAVARRAFVTRQDRLDVSVETSAHLSLYHDLTSSR